MISERFFVFSDPQQAARRRLRENLRQPNELAATETLVQGNEDEKYFLLPTLTP